MTKAEPLIGKQAYIEVIKRFSRVFIAMRINQKLFKAIMLVLLATRTSGPKGQQINGNVSEIWTANNGNFNP